MNRTTEGSRAIKVLAGGYFKEVQENEIQMPPKDTKQVDEVMDCVLNGVVTFIKVNDGKIEDLNFTKQQKEQIIKARSNRKTETALRRTKQEELNLR